MGANPNVQPRSSSLKKPASSEAAKPSRLDQYGRDPQSPSEQLRSLQGYAQLHFRYLADLPRLMSGGASWAFLNTVQVLVYKQPAKDGKQQWTGHVTLEELCDYTHYDERQVQRVLAELDSNNVIELKRLARGRYNIRLATERWRECDDYAVWKKKQAEKEKKVTPIAPEVAEDEALLEVSREAKRLTKKPQTARPGRRLRTMKIDVGVRELVCQNDDAGANLSFDVVIEPGGRQVVSVRTASGLSVVSESAKPSKAAAALHPRVPEVAGVFDPILQRQGVPLLSFDPTALNSAAAEMREMPIEVLETFLNAPRGRDSHSSRASRPIKNGLACVAIVKECRLNWEATAKQRAASEGAHERDMLLQELGLSAGPFFDVPEARKVMTRLSCDPDLTGLQQQAARRLLEILK